MLSLGEIPHLPCFNFVLSRRVKMLDWQDVESRSNTVTCLMSVVRVHERVTHV